MFHKSRRQRGNIMKLRDLFICAFLALLLPSVVFAADLTGKTIEVNDPFVRAVPPGASNSVLFMTLKNSGKTDLIISEISSPLSRVAEVHMSMHKGGMMQMHHVPELTIKAGESVSFSPDGYHIMLIGLKNPLKEGTVVPLTLKFKNGDTFKIDAPVRKLMKKMEHRH